MMDLPVYDAVEIQVAIDVAAVTTGVARIPPGIYVATAPVRLTSNVKLIFDPAAILRRKFATNEATLWQAEPGTKIVNVSVSGGRIDNADANGSTYPGPQISLYGDNVAISEMQVLNFHSLPGTRGFGGNGINITGNYVRTTGMGEIAGELPLYGTVQFPYATGSIYYDVPQLGRLTLQLQRTYYIEQIVPGNNFGANLVTIAWTHAF